MDIPARPAIIDRFQTAELDFLVMTMAVGGTGLTITKAACLVFVKEPGNTGLHEQCVARAHRFGNLNWNGIIVHEIYNADSPPELHAKGRREGKMAMTVAAVNAALKDIRNANKTSEDMEE